MIVDSGYRDRTSVSTVAGASGFTSFHSDGLTSGRLFKISKMYGSMSGAPGAEPLWLEPGIDDGILNIPTFITRVSAYSLDPARLWAGASRRHNDAVAARNVLSLENLLCIVSPLIRQRLAGIEQIGTNRQRRRKW